MKLLFNTGINITMNNWFTDSPLLAKFEKNKTAVDTLRKNRNEISQVAKSTANRTSASMEYYECDSQVLLSFIDRKSPSLFYSCRCCTAAEDTVGKHLRLLSFRIKPNPVWITLTIWYDSLPDDGHTLCL